jgi:hypothetical protein
MELGGVETSVISVTVISSLDSPDILGLLVDVDADALFALSRLGSLPDVPPVPTWTLLGSSISGSPKSGHLQGKSSLRPKIIALLPVVSVPNIHEEEEVLKLPLRGRILPVNQLELGRRTCTLSHGRRRRSDARSKAPSPFNMFKFLLFLGLSQAHRSNAVVD